MLTHDLLGQANQLMTRAIRAYFISDGAEAAPPSHTCSGTEKVAGKEYVTLRNINGILAVYRVRNDGILKRLKRWPAAVETW